ncbi:hypothetical protein PPERSA_12786 [Pseudocohnilembus persalinus]|uniref:Uncharacterized protein n=1 Tax=Pseudocohnilembus persalinus TaxID=266149 RepID=A0A0V0QEC6_PSEPJ|nr:hypothetical protein PPERSA_12786 [Pseudocohnilembus persalinus]|eukprot:KRX00567.1 hypothetical protein PPERSA_12786 [Pseudocohnilembus persalinus]
MIKLDEMEKNQADNKSDSQKFSEITQNYAQLVSLAADGFGFEMGSNLMFDRFCEIACPHIEKIKNKKDLDIFIKGFVYSYRGNQKILDLISFKIQQIVEEQYNYTVQINGDKETLDQLSESGQIFSVTELAQISKSLYMAEYQNKKLEFLIEKFIVTQLKDVGRITLEEILECVKSYTITRIGSRQIYKLLEIIIRHRFEDLKKNQEICQKIYVFYAKSGLCSSELLEQLELQQ